MRTFKIKASNTSLRVRAEQLRRDSNDVLSKFCTQKILDSNLATKTFNYEFDFAGRQNGALRKSAQKLRDILYKAVKKKIIFLDYSANGDLLKNYPAGGNGGIFTLKSWPFKHTIPGGSGTADRRGEFEQIKYSKIITRYCRYLNYLAVKNKIPLHLTPSFSLHVISSQVEDYQKWVVSKTARLEPPKQYEVYITCEVSVLLNTYVYRNFRATLDYRNIAEMETYLQNKASEDPQAARALKDLGNLNNWAANPYHGRIGARSIPDEDIRFRAPEKMFLILNSMQKVICSFTRLTSYDTQAFNVGSTGTA